MYSKGPRIVENELKVMRNHLKTQTFFLPALIGVFLLLSLAKGPWLFGMTRLFPSLQSVVYPLAPFSQLVWEHIVLVFFSSALATLMGVGIGIALTRTWGRDFLPPVSALASIGQTFPPVAVLAIAVPVVGFGFKPTVIALFLYGLLPVLRNTLAGIESVSPDVIEAARGMGMKPHQILFKVEIPLSAPIIIAGVRVSTVINIGTAALGATIGAGGLGKPIIAGLIGENPAYILEGAILVGFLAIIVDRLLGMAVSDNMESTS
jgi:osmoprotectant transport system permease protein